METRQISGMAMVEASRRGTSLPRNWDLLAFLKCASSKIPVQNIRLMRRSRYGEVLLDVERPCLDAGDRDGCKIEQMRRRDLLGALAATAFPGLREARPAQ